MKKIIDFLKSLSDEEKTIIAIGMIIVGLSLVSQMFIYQHFHHIVK